MTEAQHGSIPPTPIPAPPNSVPQAIKDMLGGMYEVDTWSLNTSQFKLGPFVTPVLESTGNPLLDAVEAMTIQLNIDIDGLNPTFAVSGTVQDRRFPSAEPSYFIGRATTAPLPDGIRVHVGDFRLIWPVSEEIFDEAEIVITRKKGRYDIQAKENLNGSTLAPIASIVFSSHASGRSAGVFSGWRRTRFFRQLRLFVVREEGVDIQPYDTLSHPKRADRGASRRRLSVVDALREAGIRVERGSDRTVDRTLAGSGGQWDESEVHDALLAATASLAPREKWRDLPPNPDLFLFVARRANDDRLAGVSFALAGDNDTLLGGGAAVFTECPAFHSLSSRFIQGNQPADIALRRERFFTTMHELGHAMNLVHSDIKNRQFVWPGPWWQPAGVEFGTPRSFMSTPGMERDQPDVSEFYSNFAFRFDDDERLYLRHAPGRFLEPKPSDLAQVGVRLNATGNDQTDVRFEIRTRRPEPVLGEPVRAELRLDTTSRTPVMLMDRPHPANGSVVLTVTDPFGRERLFRPIVTRRELISSVSRSKKDEAFYEPLDLTVDAAGIVFPYSGLYTVTATYRYQRRDGDRNLNDLFATSSMRIMVRPPVSETAGVTRELFDRRVAHVLANGGSRIDQEINGRLSRCLKVLPGEHPISMHLRAALARPLSYDRRLYDGNSVRIAQADPDKVVQWLLPIVPGEADRQALAADTLGMVPYNGIVRMFADAASRTGNKASARGALRAAHTLFEKRSVPKPVIREIAALIDTLQ